MEGNNLLFIIITIIVQHAWKTHFWNIYIKKRNKSNSKNYFVITQQKKHACFIPHRLQLFSSSVMYFYGQFSLKYSTIKTKSIQKRTGIQTNN